MSIAAQLNEITSTIIRCAIQVHRTLGPGLLESAYLICLAREMILNFGADTMRDGIHRVVNDFPPA
jgi:hypothetical protein